MNMTYNNELTRNAYPARRKIIKKTAIRQICEIIFFLLSCVCEIVSSELFAILSKITAFGFSFIGLVSVAHHLEIGAIGFLPALSVAVLLIFVVSLAFKRKC